MGIDNFINRLKSIVGEKHVLLNKEDLLTYMQDASYFEGNQPIAVVSPRTANEVSEILKLCNEYGVPVYTRGGGTSLTGASTPLDGIVLNMGRFDKIIEVNIRDRYTVAESGVRIDDLNLMLSQYNYIYPIDPGSSLAATIGGTIALNAGGIRGVRYGSTKEWILGLEVVLPNGEIVEFGERTLKRSIGYDLTALMVGSEGTLGVITKAILKITPLQVYASMILLYYDSAESVSDAIGLLNENGLIPIVAEFVNKKGAELSLKRVSEEYYEKNANWVLMILIEDPDKALKILSQTNPLMYKKVNDKNEIDKLFIARKRIRSVLIELEDTKNKVDVSGDIVVPPSQLGYILKELEDATSKYGFKNYSMQGHIGDGNIHWDVFYDLNTQKDILKSFTMETAMMAVKHNGCISAEHGIGMEKKEALVEEFKYKNTLYNLELYRGIKKVFDPNGIMNRGKLFD